MTREIKVKPGDRLWPLLELIERTHYDDLPKSRLADIFDLIDAARITEADGAKRLPIRNSYREDQP